MKILVCGGRDFTDYEMVKQMLDPFIGKVHLIIHGGARGADSLAGRWAKENTIQCKVYPADWDKYYLAAGPIRNSQMLDENPDVDLVIAFPGGKGTADMVSKARKASIETIEIGGT